MNQTGMRIQFAEKKRNNFIIIYDTYLILFLLEICIETFVFSDTWKFGENATQDYN